MKVLILGFEKVDYVKKTTNEPKKGLSVYIGSKSNPNVTGMATDSQWIDAYKLPEAYAAISSLALDEPAEADFEFQQIIGLRYPALVGVTINA